MNNITANAHWNAGFSACHPAFSQLPDAPWHQYSDWPECTALNALLPAGSANLTGKTLSFVAQDSQLPWPQLYYEQRIAEHGLIATRRNWHDFFNSMIWSNYPLTKANISACHADEIAQRGLQRSPKRDALTLFDETGCIVVSSSKPLLQQILDFQWHAVFVTQKAIWSDQTECRIFGHALFEKLLTPYIGTTANALLLWVDERYFDLSPPQRGEFVDHQLSRRLQRHLLSRPSVLNPFPLLGVPAWWPVQDHAFYSNRQYFRAKSRPRDAAILTVLN